MRYDPFGPRGHNDANSRRDDDLDDVTETMGYAPVGGPGLSGGRPPQPQQQWRAWPLRPDMGDADPHAGRPIEDADPASAVATQTDEVELPSFRGQQPGERIVFIMRQSWLLPAAAAAPIALGFIALFTLHIAFVGIGGAQAGPFIEVILLAPLGVLLIRWAIRNLLSWLSTVYILTDQRLIVAGGYLRRIRKQAGLVNVQTVRAITPNVFAALIDMGTVEVTTAGNLGEFYLRGIFHPEELARVVLNAQQTARTGGGAGNASQRGRAGQATPDGDDGLRPAVRAALDSLASRDAATANARRAEDLRVNQAADLRFGLLHTRMPITLLPGERVLERIHRHWFVLVEKEALPVAIGAVVIALGVLVGNIGGPSSGTISTVLTSAGAAIALIWGVLIYSNYVDDIFILTTHRVIDIDRLYFIFAEGWHEALYPRVQDVQVSVPFLGRIFGYGMIVVETAGRSPDIEMNHIGHPLAVQDHIFSLINANKERDAQSAAARQRQEYRQALAGMLNELLVDVPDVRRLPLLDAASCLRRVGLKLVVEAETPTVDSPSGLVLEQSPHPGATALHGSEVLITLSRREVLSQPNV